MDLSAVMSSQNELIIIRGSPGSGKTSYAKTHFPDHVLFSADDYRYVDGAYQFNQQNCNKAHETCKAEVMKALQNGMNVVICNTFCTKR